MNSCGILQDLTASDVGLFEGVSAVKSLKLLSLTTSPEFADLPFLTLLGSFPDLEELKLTATFIQDMAVGKILAPRMELAAEKVLSHLTFPNLKQLYVEMSPEMGQQEVDLLHFLLSNAPFLKLIRVIIPYCLKNIHNQMFTGQVLDLDRASLGAEIRILYNNKMCDAICMETPVNYSDKCISFYYKDRETPELDFYKGKLCDGYAYLSGFQKQCPHTLSQVLPDSPCWQSSAYSRGFGSTFELVADVALAVDNMLKASLTNPQLLRKVPDEDEEKEKTIDGREPMPDPMDPSVGDG
ncbi:hypothetical protein KI387_021251, partial [Taxus chinensis]